MAGIAFLLFISLFGASNSVQDKETNLDPYFKEWQDNAWKRPSRCHGKQQDFLHVTRLIT